MQRGVQFVVVSLAGGPGPARHRAGAVPARRGRLRDRVDGRVGRVVGCRGTEGGQGEGVRDDTEEMETR